MPRTLALWINLKPFKDVVRTRVWGWRVGRGSQGQDHAKLSF